MVHRRKRHGKPFPFDFLFAGPTRVRQGWRSGLTRGRRRLTARQTTSTSRMTQRDVVDEGKEVEVDEAPRQPTAVSGANEVRTDWILKTGKQKITIQEAEALKASLGMTRSKRHLEVTNPDPRFRVWGPCGNMGVPPEMVLANLRNNLTHSWGPKPVDVVRKCRVRGSCARVGTARDDV